jgi:hypothetical protein
MKQINNYFVAALLFLVLLEQNIFALYSHSPKLGMSSLGTKVALWENIDDSGNYYIQAVSQPAGGSWSTPVTISSAGQIATHPKLIVDTSGNALVVWSAPDATTGNIVLFGSQLLVNTTWTTPYQISSSSSDLLIDYVLEYNETTNETLLMWSAYGSGGTDRGVYASTLILGGSWTTPVLLSGS